MNMISCESNSRIEVYGNDLLLIKFYNHSIQKEYPMNQILGSPMNQILGIKF